MDQVKVILQHVKKHHFWLLCGASVVAGLVAWMMAAGKLSKDFVSRKSEITGKFSNLDAQLQITPFPNSQWKERADELVEQQKKEVRDTWKKVYEEQAQYLKWPESLDQRFRDRVSKLKHGADIPLQDREFYMNKVREEFPKLLEIVGAERGGKRTDADLASSGSAAMMQDKVIWSSDSQTRIEDSLHFDKPPSSLQVWLTQEDLWVYQVLLTIIKKVNANSWVPPVKEITDLEIAQPAVARFTEGLAPGIIEKPKNATELSSEGAAGPATMEPPALPDGAAPAPDEGRYVTADGTAMGAGTADQEPFKRMPIYLKLRIDQRQIARLLAECANSPLPVEVTQLRIDPGNSKGSDGGAAKLAEAGGATMTGNSSFDVPIEICGIIYMYNPPDASKVGTDEPAAGAPADADAAPVVAPGG